MSVVIPDSEAKMGEARGRSFLPDIQGTVHSHLAVCLIFHDWDSPEIRRRDKVHMLFLHPGKKSSLFCRKYSTRHAS